MVKQKKNASDPLSHQVPQQLLCKADARSDELVVTRLLIKNAEEMSLKINDDYMV